MRVVDNELRTCDSEFLGDTRNRPLLRGIRKMKHIQVIHFSQIQMHIFKLKSIFFSLVLLFILLRMLVSRTFQSNLSQFRYD